MTLRPCPALIASARRCRDAVADWPTEVAHLVVEGACARTGLPADDAMLLEVQRRLAAQVLDAVEQMTEAIDAMERQANQ